jgi:hypothetical protein
MLPFPGVDGRAAVPRRVPVREYESRKTGEADVDRVVDPSPTRSAMKAAADEVDAHGGMNVAEALAALVFDDVCVVVPVKEDVFEGVEV